MTIGVSWIRTKRMVVEKDPGVRVVLFRLEEHLGFYV
jgi:hypothetical protein